MRDDGKGKFEIVCTEAVEADVNIRGRSLVLEVKNVETDKPTYQSRFVVQGHTYQKKDKLVHSANTIRQHSVRMLIAIEDILGFKI